ncbi:hypothetical protein AKO1_011855 [Acrasis kona]|uniref:Microbial-type PARG catalytic domain-containing protein n=1 Tax=Acrasis kona TaxID=1008807 RepID=A0AAW2Z7G2_9EUKA
MFHRSTRKKSTPHKAKSIIGPMPRTVLGVGQSLSRSTSTLIPEPYPDEMYLNCLKSTKKGTEQVINTMSKRVFVPLQWLHFYKRHKFREGANARRALLGLIQTETAHALVRGRYYYVDESTVIPGIEEFDQQDDDDNVDEQDDEEQEEQLDSIRYPQHHDDDGEELDETIDYTLPEWKDDSRNIQLQDASTRFIKRHLIYNSVQKASMIRYEKKPDPHQPRSITNHSTPVLTKTYITYSDSADIALYLSEHLKCKPLLITSAQQSKCSAYLSGSNSQEAELCRRSSLALCLDDPFSMDKDRSWSYPIPEFGGIYVPSCLFFREGVSHGYAFCEKVSELSVLACSSYSHPPLAKNDKKSWKDVEWKLSGKIKNDLYRKIECMFDVALCHGHDSIVLSDFACGQFECPAKHVAEIFKSVLDNDKYVNQFKFVCFGIKDRKSLVGFKAAFNLSDEMVPGLSEFKMQIANDTHADYSRMPYDYSQTSQADLIKSDVL